MAKRSDIKRVMIIGSGPIVIGQAAEESLLSQVWLMMLSVSGKKAKEQFRQIIQNNLSEQSYVQLCFAITSERIMLLPFSLIARMINIPLFRG